MKRLLSLAGLASWLASPVALADSLHSGTLCVPDPPTANVGYGNYGAQNNSYGDSATVLCPGSNFGTLSQPITSVRITVYDSTPTPNDLCCTASVIGADGYTVPGDSQTFSTATVCAPDFGSAPQVLTPTIYAQGMLFLSCTIPPRDSANGASYITSYQYFPGRVYLQEIDSPASLCAPVHASDIGNIRYSTWGVQTTGSAAVNVVCPGIGLYGANFSNPTLNVYDRTPAPNDLCCTSEVSNLVGRVVSSERKCAPTWGGGLQTIEYSNAGSGVGLFDCTIPPPDAANGYSHVTSYSFQNY